jgi:hypothetical protein
METKIEPEVVNNNYTHAMVCRRYGDRYGTWFKWNKYRSLAAAEIAS